MNENVLLPEGRELLCRELCSEDKPAVLKLFQTAKDYFMLSEGKLPDDEEEFFHDPPPGKQEDDKILFGLFEKGRPLAVADIVRDFPEPSVWMTGLLLVHGDCRKLGLGKALHQVLIEYAKRKGARFHRIGVLEQNTAALAFWKKQGFKQVSISESCDDSAIKARVLIMHLNL